MSRLLITLAATMALASWAPASPTVKRVRSGDDLQAILNTAQPGDEIRLEAGATFPGNFVLPAIEGETPITLRSDLTDSAIPAVNQRVTPSSAAAFAKIVSPNSSAALRTAPGAHHWKILALEFPNTKGGAGDIIQIGDGSGAQTELSRVPYEIELDRVYVHGDPQLGQKRGIALNGRMVAIRNSYISDIKAVGADAQAIAGWNGPGPFSIENNYLEAAGEVVLFGGSDPAIADLVPSDILVRYNQLSRPMDWRGSRWQVKNLFELKNARRVQVEHNLLENNWQAAQPGYAVLFTPRNQDGRCPWCVIESVEFAHNVLRNTSAAINISGHDSPNQSRQTNAIAIHDNLFTQVTTRLGGNGWGVLIGDGPRDVSFDRNTFEFDGSTMLYAYGGPIEGFTFTNNAGPHGAYGINGADASTGTLTLKTYFPGATVTGNWLSGGPSGKYPAGNRFDGPFDGDHAAPAGADVAALRALAEAIPKGLMPGAPQPPRNLRITSSGK